MKLTTIGCVFAIAAVTGACSSSDPPPRYEPPRPVAGIVFDDDTQDVWRVAPDGSLRRRLTRAPEPEFDPTWSPDGRRIAYRSETDGDAEIYVMDSDGARPRNLTRNPAADYSPAWAPDGQRIAFASDRDGVRNDIYVMDADGRNLRRVTDNPAVDEYPTWSPDGSRLAFVTDRDGDWEIYVTGSDGSDERRLTHEGGKLPAWSPDGRWIAFQREHGETPWVWVIAPDGSSARRVARGLTPGWAPDGGALLVATERGLDVIALSGRVRRQVAAAPALNPDWVDPG